MDLHLKNKTALITGGTKGIGYAIAETLASEGANLILVARTTQDLKLSADQLMKKYNIEVKTIAADLSSSKTLPALLIHANDIDIVINNAGAIPGGNINDVDELSWRQSWDLKVYGYINLTRAFFQAMTNNNKKGVIINITGVAALKIDANYIAGSSANASLEAFTRAAGAYSLEHGVRILAVSPGAVQTQRIIDLMKNKARNDHSDPEQWQTYLQKLPLGRAALPEEVANLVTFLASDRSAYTSGTIHYIDGGHNARGSSFG